MKTQHSQKEKKENLGSLLKLIKLIIQSSLVTSLGSLHFACHVTGLSGTTYKLLFKNNSILTSLTVQWLDSAHSLQGSWVRELRSHVSCTAQPPKKSVHYVLFISQYQYVSHTPPPPAPQPRSKLLPWFKQADRSLGIFRYENLHLRTFQVKG